MAITAEMAKRIREIQARSKAQNTLTREQIDQRIADRGDAPIVRNETQSTAQQIPTVEQTPVIEQPTTQIEVPDYTEEINQQYANTTQSLLNQLRQRIAESTSSQRDIISNAPEQYNPLRAESEVQRTSQLRSALERSANLGDRGGVGRQEALLTQTEGANRLNQINLAQQQTIDAANAEIARLQNEGRYQEAQIIAEQNAARLNALQSQGQQTFSNQLNAAQLNASLQSQAQSQAESQFQNSIMANYNDLAAYANQLTAQGAPQWQIDAVNAARQQKIIDQNLDQYGNPLATTPDFSQTMQKWNAGLTLTPQEMAVIGATTATMPVTTSGTTSTALMTYNQALDNAMQMLPNGTPEQIQTLANQLMTGQSVTTPQSTAPTQDEYMAFITQVRNTMNTDPVRARQALVNNRQNVIDAVGLDTYNARIAEIDAILARTQQRTLQ